MTTPSSEVAVAESTLLPSKAQNTSGSGVPPAEHSNVASRPDNTLVFAGGRRKYGVPKRETASVV